MKVVAQILSSILLMVVAANELFAKEWRGLVPLRSTRADIVNLFGQCGSAESVCGFTHKNEDVHIVFSSRLLDFSNSNSECARTLPLDTVLLIEIKPVGIHRVAELHIDRRVFRVFDPASPPGQGYKVGYKAYIDEHAGFIINTFKGKIVQLDYIATSEDKHLCPTYYDEPEAFVQVALFYHSPPLSVTCPPTKPRAGDIVSFSADTAADPKIRFVWTLTAGRILKGQNTRTIMVDTHGLAGQVLTASVGMQISRSHPIETTSCAVDILPEPKN